MINRLATGLAQDGATHIPAGGSAQSTMEPLMDYVTLTLLAHLSAHRRLLINLYTCRLLSESEPVEQTLALREAFMRAPTHAPEEGSGLDPATSDMLAAMTDETIDDIMLRVLGRVRESTAAQDAGASAPLPCDTHAVRTGRR